VFPVRYELNSYTLFRRNSVLSVTIIALEGKKQVSSAASSERGTLVAVCVSVNATGNCVSAMSVFQMKNCHDHFLRGWLLDCVRAWN
jgi:hypothetical protein